MASEKSLRRPPLSSSSSSSQQSSGKQKTYGKSVKSKVSGWFGRSLWTEIEPVVPAPSPLLLPTAEETRAGSKKIKKKKSRKVEKEFDERDEEGEGEEMVQRCLVKQKEDFEVRGKRGSSLIIEEDELEIVEGMLKLEVADGKEGGKKETVKAVEKKGEDKDKEEEGAEDRGKEEEREQEVIVMEGEIIDLMRSPAESIKENSDKENESPPSPVKSNKSCNRNSHGRRSIEDDAPPSTPTRDASPREALKDMTPEIVVIESPSRKYGVRKKADRISGASLRSNSSSPLKKIATPSPSPLKKEISTSANQSKRENEAVDWEEPITVWEDKEAEDVIIVKQTVKAIPEKEEVQQITEILESEDENEVEDEARNEDENENEIKHISKEKKEEQPEPIEKQQGIASPVEELLRLCTVQETLDFTAHINYILTHSVIRKLGEASYSEVYLQSKPDSNSTSVMKIIPFGGVGQCQLESIIQEVRVTKAMSGTEGFIGFHGAYVVQGKFPESFLEEWDYYDEERGSENERPDFYEDDQLFSIIMLENGGRDLEHFDLRSWEEALDIFWQVVSALARGERDREFEHRDLHFGNIVIQRLNDSLDFNSDSDSDSDPDPATLLQNLSLAEPGPSLPTLKVALIDYTLSRARCQLPGDEKDIEFATLDDEALFTGKGDYQFDIYRFMRTHLSSGLVDPAEEYIEWNVFAPKTNVYWIHYLTNILLMKMGLEKPAARGRNRGSEKEMECWRVLEMVAKRIDPRRKRFGKEKAKGEKGKGKGSEVGSAREVVEWAVEEGFLEEVV